MPLINSGYQILRRWIRKLFHWTRLFLVLPIHIAELRLIRRAVKLKSNTTQLIAIALIEHLGDIVASEPIVEYLRNEYKDAHLIWFVRRPYRELIDSNKDIDRTYELMCLTEWIVLQKLHVFDVVVDLHFQGRMCPLCLIPLKKRFGDPSVTFDNYLHHGNLLASFTRSAGIAVEKVQPAIHIPNQARIEIDRFDLPEFLVTIHCSSNETKKDWPAEKWRDTVHAILQDDRLFIAEIGTEPFLELESIRFINLCGKLSILESAEVIRRSKLFIGIDSGPAQLANAVMTQGIILLGTYNHFTKYVPYSGFYADPKNADLLYADGPINELETALVIKAAQKRLEQTFDH